MQERLWDRSPAPRLTPEQLNAIDLLILGKTDREVSELIGVRRETVTKWHKNPFFTAELNVKRDALWIDSKLRLRALASEAVNVLTNGLHSSDEKIAITSAGPVPNAGAGPSPPCPPRPAPPRPRCWCAARCWDAPWRAPA